MGCLEYSVFFILFLVKLDNIHQWDPINQMLFLWEPSVETSTKSWIFLMFCIAQSFSMTVLFKTMDSICQNLYLHAIDHWLRKTAGQCPNQPNKWDSSMDSGTYSQRDQTGMTWAGIHVWWNRLFWRLCENWWLQRSLIFDDLLCLLECQPCLGSVRYQMWQILDFFTVWPSTVFKFNNLFYDFQLFIM